MPFLIPLLLIGGAIYFGVRINQGRWITRRSAARLRLEAEPDQPSEILPSTTDECAVWAEETQTQRYIKASAYALGIAVAGIWYPALGLLSLPLLGYALFPFYRAGVYALSRERRMTANVVDMLFFTGTILMGYYFAAALVVWFLHLGQRALLQTEAKSRESLVDIFAEQPRSVWIQQDEIELEIPFEKIQVGDRVILRAGEIVPVDGVIIDGVASIDQHLLTGEAQTAEKGVGDSVFTSTTVLSGRIIIRVEKAGAETVAARISEILGQNAEFRQSVQLRGQEIADRAALPTLGVAAASWPMNGGGAALAVLKSSIGYNLRVIAPISALNFLRLSSQQGILIKDGRVLDTLSQIDTVVFDKTGTLTLDQPSIGAIHPYRAYSEDQVLYYAAAAETKQTHPIARAIMQEAMARNLSLPGIEDSQYEVGYGIKVILSDRVIRVGSRRFMEMEAVPLLDTHILAKEVYEQGHSLVYVAVDEQLGGVIELCTTVRPEVRRIVSELRQHQLSMYIISGDHEQPTQNLAQALEIDHYVAEMLPEQKGDLIAQLQAEGHSVAFVGDGINDAIALRQADVSISLSGASSVATDVAQIIMLDGQLSQLGQLFDIAADFETNMQNHLKLSVIPSLICVGGVFFLGFGFTSGIVLYSLGLAAGLWNASLPLGSRQRDSATAQLDQV